MGADFNIWLDSIESGDIREDVNLFMAEWVGAKNKTDVNHDLLAMMEKAFDGGVERGWSEAEKKIKERRTGW